MSHSMLATEPTRVPRESLTFPFGMDNTPQSENQKKEIIDNACFNLDKTRIKNKKINNKNQQ